MLNGLQWGALAGGIGLFLLGMWLMTDGLRMAAGGAMRGILARSTRTRWRALASGFGLTALVQSSSAVTVAAVGFVNAGLLALGPALWVLFGANVGTTMTGWLVAVLGLQIKVDAFALPLIAAGMLLRLTGPGTRREGWGLALAGFGVLFLGIAVLRDGFAEVAAQVRLPQGEGVLGIAALVGVGAVLTLLVQSSSAATAMVLTAAQGGLLGLPAAAAVVIGTNIGTTGTAVIAAMGATSNARRAAAAHVLFNVLTAVVALALLPWLVQLTARVGDAVGAGGNVGTALALFHTLFNVLGVLLIWPLADRLGAFLARRFRTAEEDEARPRYLDAATAQVPALAVEALAHEVARFGSLALRSARELTPLAQPGQAEALARAQRTLAALDAALDDFVVRLNRAGMAPEAARRLSQVLRRTGYFASVVEQLPALPGPAVEPSEASASVLGQVAAVRREAGDLLSALDTDPVGAGPLPSRLNAPAGGSERSERGGDHPAARSPRAELDARVAEWDRRYRDAKAALLDAAAVGTLSPPATESLLRSNSALRRVVQQAHKAMGFDGDGPTAAAGPRAAASLGAGGRERGVIR